MSRALKTLNLVSVLIIMYEPEGDSESFGSDDDGSDDETP